MEFACFFLSNPVEIYGYILMAIFLKLPETSHVDSGALRGDQDISCAPLVADLLLFCYESLSRENQADIIEAFNSTSRYARTLIIY